MFTYWLIDLRKVILLSFQYKYLESFSNESIL